MSISVHLLVLILVSWMFDMYFRKVFTLILKYSKVDPENKQDNGPDIRVL